MVLSPKESGELIAKNAKFLTIHSSGIDNIAKEVPKAFSKIIKISNKIFFRF